VAECGDPKGARARALLAERGGEGPGSWLAREPDAIVGHAYYVFRL
jgi:hypothetical protein